MIDIITSPLFSLFVGAAITWFFAWYYFKCAGDELKAEAKSLHAATSTIAYLLEHPDAKTEVQRDGQGRVTGIVVNISGTASMSFTSSATLTTVGDGA
jgi:hypothetical protein